MRKLLSTTKTRVTDRVSLLLEPPAPDAATQLALRLQYERDRQPLDRPLSDFGFSCYSQTDEDGILLYLFALLGTSNRSCVEICAGTGLECNAANLLLNHGWHGLLVDGNEENVRRGTAFYARSRKTYVYPPKFVHAWVTRDNVNDLIAGHGFTGEVDLLSLDMDGVDYWIWKAITVISPRVVVLEYQDILGPERSWTVPYSDSFSAADYAMTGAMPNFAGASLRAFVKLGSEKGYRFVGCNSLGYNAFFVREDLGQDLLPTAHIESAFLHPKNREAMEERFPLVAGAPWVEV